MLPFGRVLFWKIMLLYFLFTMFGMRPSHQLLFKILVPKKVNILGFL